MKVFAVVPALMVLVSLCGSPVPPPPGTVTGAVFFDANRNSIRDSCDSPMSNTQVVVNGPDGQTASERTDNSGAFEIDDAPVGDGIVTLFTAEGLVWPITTAPQAVHVESSKEVGGVEIGSASKAVYDATKTSISGVIFDDANANGEVDRDECPISDAVGGFNVSSGDRIAVSGPGTYELKNLPEGYEMEVTASYSPFSYPLARERLGPRPLRPTNGVSATEPCTSKHRPKPRYGPLIYEANIGFALAVGNGTVAGVVFEDSDGDGVQDEDEAGVAGVWLRLYASGDCAFHDTEKAAATDADGAFKISGLYPGSYVPQVDINPIGEYSADFVTMSERPAPVTITDGGRATLNLPVKVGPAGSIRVLVFDDDDGDGVRDAGEAAVSGIEVCAYLEKSASDQYYGSGYGNCGATESDGVATIELLPEGSYSVSLSGGPVGGLVAYPAPVTTRVTSGAETRLDYAVAMLTPEEQVIPPGTGETLPLDVCYSDPAWVQPSFDVQLAANVTPLYGIDFGKAQLIYGHGIYTNTSEEMGIWATMAGLDWGKAPPDCGYNYQALYVLVGYEPLEVVTGGNVLQIRVSRRETGLFALNLPFPTEAARTELFVDEKYQPIVRCAPYGNCEWNDGTVPNYHNGGLY